MPTDNIYHKFIFVMNSHQYVIAKKEGHIKLNRLYAGTIMDGARVLVSGKMPMVLDESGYYYGMEGFQ